MKRKFSLFAAACLLLLSLTACSDTGKVISEAESKMGKDTSEAISRAESFVKDDDETGSGVISDGHASDGFVDEESNVESFVQDHVNSGVEENEESRAQREEDEHTEKK